MFKKLFIERVIKGYSRLRNQTTAPIVSIFEKHIIRRNEKLSYSINISRKEVIYVSGFQKGLFTLLGNNSYRQLPRITNSLKKIIDNIHHIISKQCKILIYRHRFTNIKLMAFTHRFTHTTSVHLATSSETILSYRFSFKFFEKSFGNMMSQILDKIIIQIINKRTQIFW